MTMKRTIGNYELDVLAIVDGSKALKSLGFPSALRVLNFLVDKFLGSNYRIQKVS